MQIRQDDLTGEEITGFLREHLENMNAVTPSGSVHALPLGDLRSPTVTFWSVWEGAELLGCGALKELDAKTGEVKSMRTAEAHRSRGVGGGMLEYIIREAQRRAYTVLKLETGATLAFAPARALYLRHGFSYCGPFADYTNDPNSVFMTKEL